MIEPILYALKSKRILIVGYGREGKSSLRFILKHQLSKQIGIADKQAFDTKDLDEFIQIYTGANYLEAINQYEIILKSPGIPSGAIPLSTGYEISSQTDLFLRAFHQQSIGITGTKGKSTTASLIHHLLSSVGKKSILTGNIGIPCFDIIEQIQKDSIVVFEMSAHQLENIKNSPHIAVLLNLFEEHLDHFITKEAYFEAKKQIYKNRGPQSVLITDKNLDFSPEALPMHTKVFPQGRLASYKCTQLMGTHNKNNVQAALLAVESCGIRIEQLAIHLHTFKALAHRLEYVGEFGGLHFYNDSIATIPEATIRALESLPKVDWLILGGFDRNINYQQLADYLYQNPVKYILLTGAAGARIKGLISSNTDYKGKLITIHSLDEAFSIMESHGSQNELCLLSPAAASYDQYDNFEQRGMRFKSLALEFKLKNNL